MYFLNILVALWLPICDHLVLFSFVNHYSSIFYQVRFFMYSIDVILSRSKVYYVVMSPRWLHHWCAWCPKILSGRDSTSFFICIPGFGVINIFYFSSFKKIMWKTFPNFSRISKSTNPLIRQHSIVSWHCNFKLLLLNKLSLRLVLRLTSHVTWRPVTYIWFSELGHHWFENGLCLDQWRASIWISSIRCTLSNKLQWSLN